MPVADYCFYRIQQCFRSKGRKSGLEQWRLTYGGGSAKVKPFIFEEQGEGGRGSRFKALN